MINDVVITRATANDAEAVLSLLRGAQLPTAGLLDHLDHTVVVRRGGRVVGSAALELYEDGALLRSVVVDSTERGTGLGQRLTEEALRTALRLGLPAVYLLTTTAERFFPRFGFEAIRRADVPPSVQRSIEFTSACPASAVVMRKRLARDDTPS